MKKRIINFSLDFYCKMFIEKYKVLKSREDVIQYINGNRVEKYSGRIIEVKDDIEVENFRQSGVDFYFIVGSGDLIPMFAFVESKQIELDFGEENGI